MTNNEIKLASDERLPLRFLVGAVLELQLKSTDGHVWEGTKRVRVTYLSHSQHETTDPYYTVVPLKGRRIDRRYSLSHRYIGRSDWGWWFTSRSVLPASTYRRRFTHAYRVTGIRLIEGPTAQQTTEHVPYAEKRPWGRSRRSE